MFATLLRHMRGVLSLAIYFLNTLFWVGPLYAAAIVKLLVPIRTVRRWCDVLLNGCANNWIGINNLNQRLLCNIRWHVSGLEDLRIDDWYLVLANHQTWVDILVLQKIFYRKIPFLKFFLKKELFWFPIMGQAWWALDFPFMKRYSRSFIKAHPHLAGRDLEITRKACEKFKNIPVSVMNFVEGTRFDRRKHRRQHSPYTHLLRPKAGGIAFTLGAMGHQLNSILDVTIAYPGGPGSFWDYLCGEIRDIRVHVRSLPITDMMLGDYFTDTDFKRAFQNWLNTLWSQKDRCIEDLLSAPLPATASGGIVTPRHPEPMPVLTCGTVSD